MQDIRGQSTVRVVRVCLQKEMRDEDGMPLQRFVKLIIKTSNKSNDVIQTTTRSTIGKFT